MRMLESGINSQESNKESCNSETPHVKARFIPKRPFLGGVPAESCCQLVDRRNQSRASKPKGLIKLWKEC